MTLLEVRNLTIRYNVAKGDVRAVENISFRIDRGETLGIVGESGCGKTTLAYALVQLLPRNARVVEGEILFKGKDLVAASRRSDGSLDVFHPSIRQVRWRGISMIFQGAMNAFNPVHTVGAQIGEAITVHDEASSAAARERTRELFKMVGIPLDRVDAYPHELSGGTKQRAMIAMALACGPDLVIADEPTTALDVILQDKILAEIARIQRERNMAMIMISHDVSAVAEVAHRIAVMYAGRIVEEGSTRDVFRHPSHPYTVALLNSFPSLRGAKRRLEGIPGFPPDLVTPPAGCAFHPRCTLATAECADVLPPDHAVTPGHRAACLRVDEVQRRVLAPPPGAHSEIESDDSTPSSLRFLRGPGGSR